MTRFFTALSQARDTVDVNIAAGVALPQWNRLRTLLLSFSIVAIVFLAIGYLDLRSQLRENEATIQKREIQASKIRQLVIPHILSIDKALLEIRARDKRLEGQVRASTDPAS